MQQTPDPVQGQIETDPFGINAAPDETSNQDGNAIPQDPVAPDAEAGVDTQVADGLDVGTDQADDFAEPASPDETDAERSIRLEYDRKLQRIQNRLRKEMAGASGSTESDDLKRALGQLLSDPESKGPVIDQLRQRLGVQAQQPPPERQIIVQRRRELMAKIEPDAVEPFSALQEHVIEERYMPRIQQAFAALEARIEALQNVGTASQFEKETKDLPAASKYRDQAQKIKSAVERGGGQMSWAQAVIAASNGKVLTEKRAQVQKQVVRNAASERPGGAPTSTIGSPNNAKGNNGKPTKLTPKDILASFRAEKPGQYRALEKSVGLGSILR